MKKLENKKILITGASSGIGYASAIALAKEGAILCIHYNSNKVGIDSLQGELDKMGSTYYVIKGDVEDRNGCDSIIDQACNHMGNIDIMFHNAGAVVKRMMIDEITDEVIDKVIDLNFKSCLWLSRKVVPVMKKAGGGRIIFVSSVAGRMGGGPGASVYGACKGAVITLTKALATELGKHSILVNNIAPGFIETPFHKDSSKEMIASYATKTPINKNGIATDISEAVVYLCGDGSNFMTGATMDINGGLYMV